LLDARQVRSGAEIWILIRLHDSEVCPRLLDSSDRIPEIVVLYERGTNELVQLLVPENFEPFEIRNRVAIR
jgi:hypothetical protein